jgi:hypothetical protein
MGKWHGKIGYAKTVETNPGVWEETTIEREYGGDLIRNIRKLDPSGNVNDDINIASDISIVADPFARENSHTIRYAEIMGVKWKVASIDIQPPRLILTIGGLYNG